MKICQPVKILSNKLSHRFKKSLLLIFFLYFLFIYFNYDDLMERVERRRNFRGPGSILIWTDYHGFPNWTLYGKRYQIEGKIDCSVDCHVTRDRSYLQKASAVLFTWRDVDLKHMPKTKVKGQKWILYNMESPINSVYYYGDDSIGNTTNNIWDRMDLLMSYRSDGDVYAPYGRIQRRKEGRKLDLIDPMSRNVSIVWMASNCNSTIGRERLVKELSKYIDIEIIGSCGTRICLPYFDPFCYKYIERRYRFYLSFENSLCKDYVTEKAFAIMQYDVVPIVYGGADYGSLLPNNSYIEIKNFKSAEALANYLYKVGSDVVLYNSFFEWKKDFESVVTDTKPFCSLCEKMAGGKFGQRIKDMVKFWFMDSECRMFGEHDPSNDLFERMLYYSPIKGYFNKYLESLRFYLTLNETMRPYNWRHDFHGFLRVNETIKRINWQPV